MNIHDTLNLNEELLLNIVGRATNLYKGTEEGEYDQMFYAVIQWAFTARRVLAETGKSVDSPIFDMKNWWVCGNCGFECLQIHPRCHGCGCSADGGGQTAEQVKAQQHLSNQHFESGINNL